jgi:hypothetical protein
MRNTTLEATACTAEFPQVAAEYRRLAREPVEAGLVRRLDNLRRTSALMPHSSNDRLLMALQVRALRRAIAESSRGCTHPCDRRGRRARSDHSLLAEGRGRAPQA